MSKQVKTGDLSAYCSLLREKLGSDGVIIIAQNAGEKGQLMAQQGMSHEKIREALSIAIYYNEKEHLETKVDVNARQ